MTISRIILTTGGTGGHIFPAVAVAEEIRRRNPTAMILFVGSKYGSEADIAANAGYGFAGLPVRGIMGKGLKGLLNLPRMLQSVTASHFILRKTQPEVVIGFGGYAAFAATLTACMKGIPVAVHEQNSLPGMTNRTLGKFVDRVFLSMPDTRQCFPKAKTISTGNPVRKAVMDLYENFDVRLSLRQQAGENAPRRLLIMGGSLGATAINKAAMSLIGNFADNGIEVWHQTGKNDYETVRQAYRDAGITTARVDSFITNMHLAYEWADLALCRAGASSIAELTSAGLPAVLVPFPQAAQDHQRHNARFMEMTNAAVVMDQTGFEQGREQALLATVMDIFNNPDRRNAMARASHRLAQPYAAATIVDNLEAMLERK